MERFNINRVLVAGLNGFSIFRDIEIICVSFYYK